MSQSPSKRQRTSVDTFISRGNDVTTRSNPTTPTRRASYLSPTKASLARSHPKLLLKSPGRNATASKPISIANAAHQLQAEGGKRTDRDETRDGSRQSPNPPLAQPTLQHSQDKQNQMAFADAIAQAFTDIPATAASQDETLTNHQQTLSNRAPLSPRQPRTASAQAHRRYSGDGQPDAILPKLVKHYDSSAQSTANAIEDEIELPPTPVQLGLSQAPYRPRGLASSSSGGSRNGSGRHRMRTRNNESRSITSSPLKPRALAAMQNATTVSQDGASDTRNAIESEPDDDLDPAQANMSREANEKQDELAQLETELRTLREDLEKLKALSDKLKITEAFTIDDDIHTLLLSGRQSNKNDPDSLESHSSFVKNPDAFLTLFAPAGVRLSVSTKAKTIKTQPKIVHSLAITAPEPWPLSILQLSYDVTIDAEKACIESISQIHSKISQDRDVLQRWTTARLADSLHRFDIAGLVFGAGQYFDACVARASAFHEISARHLLGTTAISSLHPGEEITPQRVLALSQYMQTSQLQLSVSPESDLQFEDSDVKTTRQVLLTYELELSWTGNIQTSIGITCSNVGPKAQKDTKELFQKFLGTEGVVGAFDRVWKLVGNTHGTVEGSGKSQGQPRKARKKIVA